MLITLVGVAVSVVLVFAQFGIYPGFMRNGSIIIDHPRVDLWVVSKNCGNFDFAMPFPEGKLRLAKEMPGVMARWRSGTPSLINDKRVKVVGISEGVRGFTTAPYVFTTYRTAQELDAAYTTDRSAFIIARIAQGHRSADVVPLLRKLRDVHLAQSVRCGGDEGGRRQGEVARSRRRTRSSAGGPRAETLAVAWAQVEVAESDETDLGHLAIGQKAEVTADAFPGRVFAARVFEIGQAVGKRKVRPEDPAKIQDMKVFETKLELLDANTEFKLGMTARAAAFERDCRVWRSRASTSSDRTLPAC